MPVHAVAGRALALTAGLAVALAPLLFAVPAQAAPECEPELPYTEFLDTSMQYVYAAEAPIGVPPSSRFPNCAFAAAPW